MLKCNVRIILFGESCQNYGLWRVIIVHLNLYGCPNEAFCKDKICSAHEIFWRSIGYWKWDFSVKIDQTTVNKAFFVHLYSIINFSGSFTLFDEKSGFLADFEKNFFIFESINMGSWTTFLTSRMCFAIINSLEIVPFHKKIHWYIKSLYNLIMYLLRVRKYLRLIFIIDKCIKLAKRNLFSFIDIFEEKKQMRRNKKKFYKIVNLSWKI